VVSHRKLPLSKFIRLAKLKWSRFEFCVDRSSVLAQSKMIEGFPWLTWGLLMRFGGGVGMPPAGIFLEK